MIVTVTLNASIDKAYTMQSPIENGTVMRVARCRNSAGGKGLNVARVIRRCGLNVMATGFAGGFNGQYLEHMLDQDGIQHDFEHIKSETRSCINVLDPQYGSTEYLEPGCEVSGLETERFLARFEEIMDRADVITMSGSVPAGVPKDIYQQLIGRAKVCGKPVILDTSGQWLQEGILAGPALIKPNQEEIQALLGKKLGFRQDVIECAEKLYDRGIPYVVVSMGSDGAVMVCKEGCYQAAVPKVAAVNTVGCGDAMVGGLAVALERNMVSEEALRYAVAVAAANACSWSTGDFELEVMKEIYQRTQVVRE